MALDRHQRPGLYGLERPAISIIYTGRDGFSTPVRDVQDVPSLDVV